MLLPLRWMGRSGREARWLVDRAVDCMLLLRHLCPVAKAVKHSRCQRCLEPALLLSLIRRTGHAAEIRGVPLRPSGACGAGAPGSCGGHCEADATVCSCVLGVFQGSQELLLLLRAGRQRARLRVERARRHLGPSPPGSCRSSTTSLLELLGHGEVVEPVAASVGLWVRGKGGMVTEGYRHLITEQHSFSPVGAPPHGP